MGYRYGLLLGLALLMGCQVVIDVRTAAITTTPTICSRLQDAHGSADYCGLALGHSDVTHTGSGTESDPYILCSPYQVNAIGTDATLVTKSYRLGADIDMSCIAGNHSMIGSSATPFTGNFDGDTKTISNWTHVNAAADYIGFFSSIKGDGINLVKDLTLSAAQVTGKNFVGILAGDGGALFVGVRTTGTVSGTDYIGGITGFSGVALQSSSSAASVSGTNYIGGLIGNAAHAELASSSFTGSVTATGNYVGGLIGNCGSIIHNSYNTGSVSSTGTHVGGLVGRLTYGIENSFNTGTVSGSTSVGGLVGELRTAAPLASILNSFSTGNVTGSGGTSTSVGLLVGTDAGAVTNSYYLASATCDADVLTLGTQACGTTATGTVAALSDFYDATLAPLSSWDFQGNSIDGTYDFWEERTGALPVAWYDAPEPFVPAMSGSGTDDDPYLITSVAEFNLIGRNHRYTGASYRLMNNLDFTATTFQEIGGGEGPFYGNFDGNGRTLSNITLAKPRTYAGVFGLAVGSDISDLTITNASISTTRLFSGIVAGWMYGTVTNCHTSGLAEGNYYTGGLVGLLYGDISDSSSSATINTLWPAAGGLVGTLVGDITRSFATGNVTGSAHTGGLVGRVVSGAVSDSFATGDVNSVAVNFPQNYGGLIGYMDTGSSLTNSYASGNVSGMNLTGGLVGRVAAATTITNSFSTGNVTGSTNSTQVGLLVGTSTATVTNSYYLATATCDANSATGPIDACNTTSTGSAAALSDFFSELTAPLDQWDFTTVWDSDAASLPVLR